MGLMPSASFQSAVVVQAFLVLSTCSFGVPSSVLKHWIFFVLFVSVHWMRLFYFSVWSFDLVMCSKKEEEKKAEFQRTFSFLASASHI
jgi:hypothetical protein